VCTVVSKLLHIVQPDRAYFGMKDAQQVAVIMQMTADLNIPTEIIPCPIIREADGLALSSRNVYLSADERSQALVLNRSLQAADEIIRQHPEASIGEVRERIRETIRTAPLADIDYVEIVAFPSLQVIDDAMPVREALKASRVMAALAVRFGRTRLIDNRLWDAEGGLV
jgi:pantoate--beta-alanine ligase